MLSGTVSNGLKLTGDLEAKETVVFTALFDKFFDLLNVSNFTNGTRNRKPFQYPFRHGEDHRLKVSIYHHYNYRCANDVSIVARNRLSLLPGSVGSKC